MPLETATYIDDLNSSNPPSSDQLKQADDHLRLIKATIKATFPSLSRAIHLEKDILDLASATTPDLSTVASNYINITGTTQIDGFATEPAGFTRLLRFDGVLVLNYNATSLQLPTSADITTAAGDHAIAVSLGSGNWRIVSYFRNNGRALTETTYTLDGLGGIAQGLHTIHLSAAGFTPELTEGAAYGRVESSTNKINRTRLGFAGTGNTRASCEFTFPKSWDEGTVTAFIDWETDATDTDGVSWNLAGLCLGDGDTIDTAYGTAVEITDVGQSSSGKQYRTAVSNAITFAGAGAGKRALLRITRAAGDADDTIAETCYLNGVTLLFTIDDPDDA